MHESPSSTQLLEAVIGFLNEVASPQLSGQAQFHARVSANALALVIRELTMKEAADARACELYGLAVQTISTDDDVSSLSEAKLRERLCAAIKDGTLDMDTPHLLASLREIAIAQLRIDQPNYSGLML